MCPTFSGRPKENDVSMGRNPVPVSMPVLWPCTSPIWFHKTPKDPHGPFKRDRDTIRIVIYLDDMLIIGRTREEVIVLRDTVIFLLQCLGFVINQKKSVMTPVQESASVSQFKGNDYFHSTEKITINKTNVTGYDSESRDNKKLTKVLGHLTSTIFAILPAKLHFVFYNSNKLH